MRKKSDSHDIIEIYNICLFDPILGNRKERIMKLEGVHAGSYWVGVYERNWHQTETCYLKYYINGDPISAYNLNKRAEILKPDYSQIILKEGIDEEFRI